MLRKSGLLTSRSKSWSRFAEEHRDNFTPVRELELPKASIRLPKGRPFVTVTEQRHFDRITDTIPGCVQTRLEEFLAGPGKQSGVKVYYLKPLCIEVGDDLHFTSREDIFAAIDKIQNEVFSEYRRMYVSRRAKKVAIQALSGALAIPRSLADYILQRRQTALDAAKTYRQYRTGECTFADLLEMTALLIVFDPAFVAELPGSGGLLLNIGHFDEIAGVRHVEM